MINNCMDIPKFDLSTISSASFNITDNHGTVKVIRVIKADLLFEIIRAHTLLMDDPKCEVTNLLDLFTGFVDNPEDVTWYTTTDPKESMEKAIMQTAREGNEIVVVEVIPLFDPDVGGVVIDK